MMSDHHALPPALARWAPALSILASDVALAMGPLVRQIDGLLAGPDGTASDTGQPDGYAGLASRGRIERLLPSQLMLAYEAPEEFIRRATAGELLYLAPAFQNTAVRGATAVLVDTGPGQLGAARLVQLAALIVVHRRASSQGRSMVVGLLGDRPGTWRKGSLPSQLDAWLAARTAVEPTPTTVQQWLTHLDAADESWLLTGPELAAQLPGHGQVLVTQEQAWDVNGVTSVRMSLRQRQIDLRLPDRDVAVRVLRGAGFRHTSVRTTTGAKQLRAPLFPSTRPRLLARGQGPDEIVSVSVPNGRPRRHRLPGPVLGASWLGRGLAVLTCVDHTLRVIVIGKPVGRLAELEVPLAAVGMSAADGAAAAELALSPLHLHAGDLLYRRAETWWRLSGDGPAPLENFTAVAAGPRWDQPRIARRADDRIVAHGVPPEVHIPSDARIVLSADGAAAWTVDGTAWQGYTPAGVVDHGCVPAGSRVIGLLDIDGPRLVTLSTGGLIVRLVTSGQSRTLTRWSGGIAEPALHPSRPWLAVPRPNGVIEVADLAANQLLRTIESGE